MTVQTDHFLAAMGSEKPDAVGEMLAAFRDLITIRITPGRAEHRAANEARAWDRLYLAAEKVSDERAVTP